MMSRQDQSNWIIVSALAVVILLSGCATTKTPYWKNTSYGTWEFNSAEIKKLPDISLRKILSLASVNPGEKVQILVRAQNLDGIAEVKQIAGSEDVIVTDLQGQEVRVKIAQITEIQSRRQIRVMPKGKTTDEAAEEAAEALTYAPLIPIAIATWPFLRASGLDEGKNADDKEKALIAYGGMSKEELIKHLGDPMEKYYCKDNYGDEEVWIYNKDQVLRGGRALFIRSADEMVYYTSHNTTFFKNSKNCSKLKK
ncbi:MAG: hypothetical protein JXO49_12610 [Deltaproteobacteria bacterium]|nr:hypothetical protein [Candidatus Anaeroferrophillus wilburensis]MBN2890170.1 hypothetical protein [Deltaproteobacteria bacterium]